MPRAVVHLERAANLSHAIPLLHVMRAREGWAPFVSFRERQEDYPSGLGPIHIERLRRLDVPLVDSPRDASPDVLLTFDAIEGRWDDVGLKVRVPASLIGKGHRYRKGQAAARDNLCDLLLVPGPLHREALEATGQVFTPLAEVGLPGLDPLLGNWVADRNLLRAQLQLAEMRRVLLYAPTWEPELAAWPVLWTRVRHLVDAHTGLILRPHPRSPREFRRACRKLAESHPAIVLAIEPEIQPYLHASDLVISDHSSVLWEAALAGKPVVQVLNPNREELDGWHDKAVELGLPAPGPHVRDLEELRAAVQDGLAHPDRFEAARTDLRARLLTAPDDGACRRVLELSEAALDGRFPVTSHEQGVRAVLRVRAEDNAGDIETTLSAVMNRAGEETSAVLVGPHGHVSGALSEWQRRWPGRVTAVASHADLPSSDHPFELLLEPGVDGASGWVRRLANHLRRRNAPNGVAPLAEHGRPCQDPDVLGLDLPDDDGPLAMDRAQRDRAAGVALTPPVPPSDKAAMVRWDSRWGADLAQRWWAEDWPRRGSRFAVKVAADVVVRFPELTVLEAGDRSVRARAMAEDRVADLAAWVQRILPDAANEPDRRTAPDTPTSTPLNPATQPSGWDELPGPLRLARHYLERGKPERARPLIEAALAETPVHPVARELAAKAGVTLPRGEEAAR